MAKSSARYSKEPISGFETRVKVIQRGLFFRSWYVDRPITVLASADAAVERTARSLGNGFSSQEGAIGLALDLPNENTFFRLIGSVDVRIGGLILGGAIDVAALLAAFPHRRVRAFKHEKQFPFGLVLCEDDEAEVAVVGELPTPEWPRIGLTMPVLENVAGARRTALGLLATYPGVLDIAVVANGSSESTWTDLLALEGEACEHLWVVREPENLGFPGGVNVGLQELWTEGWYDLFGTVHDDLNPTLNAISELADAFEALRGLGQRPGVIGPMTNKADGGQVLSLDPYRTVEELEQRAADQFSRGRRSADEVERVGSHLMLIDADALSDVGGFDVTFGRGFFSDDDWCLRARLNGYRVWVATGSYVHHEGGATFNYLAADEQTTVDRNKELFLDKWNLKTPRHGSTGVPDERASLHMPLVKTRATSSYHVLIHGEAVDLVEQASSLEFAAFLTDSLKNLPRSARIRVLTALRLGQAEAASYLQERSA